MAADRRRAYHAAVEKSAKLTFEVDLPDGQGRLREMVLYVSGRCYTAERFGKVKLNKILWRADFEAFRTRGTPVTGRSYQKLAAGPAPIEMPLVLEEMRGDGFISFDVADLGDGFVEERIRPLVKPNLRFFSQDDIGFVEESIDFYWGKSASSASELSHKIAWKSREFLDLMPYELVFLSDEKMSPADAVKFSALAQQRGWNSR